MGFIGNLSYNLFMFPFEKAVLHRFRQKAVAKAEGRVLEVGVGTGVNSRYLEKHKVKSLTVIDTVIRESVMKRMEGRFAEFKFKEGSVENIPFPDGSFDTIVFTLVFCSVMNPENGLKEVLRVLKDDGKIIFIEHVRPENHRVRKAAEKLNPLWNSFSKGCNINRETLSLIEAAGLSITPGTYKRKGVFITGIASKT